MNSCYQCGTTCDHDEYLCSFCDALFDVIQDGDNAANAIGDGAAVTEDLERRMAMAYVASSELEDRRLTGRGRESLGDGSYWRRSA